MTRSPSAATRTSDIQPGVGPDCAAEEGAPISRQRSSSSGDGSSPQPPLSPPPSPPAQLPAEAPVVSRAPSRNSPGTLQEQEQELSRNSTGGGARVPRAVSFTGEWDPTTSQPNARRRSTRRLSRPAYCLEHLASHTASRAAYYLLLTAYC
eukprot:scaffold90832_cov58-Phaeocystis_antarctica.AAC.3